MHSRVYLISGIALLISGFIIFMNSAQTLTGFAIMEDVDLNTGYLAGIWLIAAGIVLLIIGRAGHPYKFRGRDSLRSHNGQARYAARQDYQTKYHKKPNRVEAAAHRRNLHDRQEIDNLREEFGG